MKIAPACWTEFARFKTEAQGWLSLAGEQAFTKARDEGSQSPGALRVRSELKYTHAQELAEYESAQHAQKRAH